MCHIVVSGRSPSLNPGPSRLATSAQPVGDRGLGDAHERTLSPFTPGSYGPGHPGRVTSCFRGAPGPAPGGLPSRA